MSPSNDSMGSARSRTLLALVGVGIVAVLGACAGERFEAVATSDGGGAGGASGGAAGSSGFAGAATGGNAGTAGTGGTGNVGGSSGSGGMAGAGAASATCHALQFDGVDDWVKVPDAPALDGLAAVTIEAWIKPDTYPDEVQILSHHDHNLHTGYVLLIFSGGEMQFRYQFGGTNHSYGFTPVSAGVWHHVAAAYSAGTTRLFIDGVPKGQSTAIPSGVADDCTSPLAMGRAAYEDNFHFSGLIDEVRLSKVARYATAFTPAHDLEADADTVALWKFEEPGQQIKDSTGVHHGTLGADASAGTDDPAHVTVPCTH